MRIRSIRNRLLSAEAALDAPSNTIPHVTRALSESEAARYIGMSQAWLKKSRTSRFRGFIDAPPFVRSGGRRIVYRREDLDAWQDRHLERVGPQEGEDTSRSVDSGV